MNNIETLIGVEVEDRMTEMADLKTTDEAYKATADVTLKLMDRAAEFEKLKLQAEANELKREELKEAKKRHATDTIIKGVETVAKFAVPAVLAIGLTVYEQTDSAASTATKEFWKKVFRLT